MAINIIGPNLNSFGHGGDFDTDRSTWGFADGTYWVATRAMYTSPGGIYSCQIDIDSSPAFGLTMVPAKIPTPAAGKKYIARCKAKIDIIGDKPYDDATLRISEKNYTLISEVTADVDDLVGAWTDIELRFERPAGSFPTTTIELEFASVSGPSSGTLYIDDFTIHEYEDIPDPTCTLLINAPGTVIVNESAPAAADGSIDVAITGAIGTVTYSKDNVFWQSSSQFTGLTSGAYTIWALDDGVALCKQSQVFNVNLDDLDFDFTAVVTDETVSGENDGTITITTSGTGAPFTYSKDGGTIYQSSNIFSGLAPGAYAIVVKDSGGATLGRVYEVAAGEVIFNAAHLSDDPIPYQVPEGANVAEANYRLFVDVRVEDIEGSSTYNSKLQTAKPPASDGYAHFNLRQAFRGVLTATPPTLNHNTIIRLTDRIKLFKVYSGEIYDNLEEPGAYTASPPYLVMMGGISKLKYPDLDYLTTYLPTNKKFLTWAPICKEVDSTQEDYLNFWMYDMDDAQANLVIKAYFDDDTNETATITSLSGLEFGNLIQVPAGPVNSGVLTIDPAKNLTSYDLWLTNGSAEVISEVRTYKLTAFKHPRTRYYLYLNSLGAFEVLRTVGFSEINTKIAHTVTEQLLTLGYGALDGQYRNAPARDQIATKVSTGFFAGGHGQQWMEYMRQVALSRKVYDITDGTRIPVINQTTEILLQDNQTNKRFARFTFLQAYSENNFTPAGT